MTQQLASNAPCRVCGTAVPAAAFCESCGAHLFRLPGNGPDWLRVHAYAAAPEEQVLRLSVATTLFPHLRPRSRPAFRAALAGLLMALIVLALLRWQAALVGVTALGVPLVFLLYLLHAEARRDLRVWRLLLTVLTGAGLGVGWALLTGPALAGSYLNAHGMGETATLVWQGIAVPVGGALLMVVPAILLRVLRPPTRESLDGYLIGALGAVAYVAAAALTRMTPQLATGLVARDQPAKGLLVQGGINGVAMPVTAIVAGGLVGAALWFTRGGKLRDQQRRPMRAVVLPALVIVGTIYVWLGLIDIARLPQGLQLGLHLLVAALAVLTLRVGLHLALLHEAPDVTEHEPVLCPECRHVVPDAAFCPSCGVASRASSRSSRNARRSAGAQLADDGHLVGDPQTAALFPGYGVPAGAYTAPLLRYTLPTRLLSTLGVALAAVVAVVVAVSIGITPAPARYACPPHCGRPPISHPVDPGSGEPTHQPLAPLVPVQTYPRLTSADGSFSVAYYPWEKVTKNADGVVLRSPDVDGEIQLFGTPAHHRTPLQIVKEFIADHYPNAQTDYQIPNAMVGYEPGYGEVDDFTPDNPNTQYARGRVLVMTAVKNGLALVVVADGPYVEFTPQISGHPSAANLEIALEVGNSANSFTWNKQSAH
ncbi:MAG: zinc ribbon domain-containing protein [Mycobacterium sp.]